MSSYLYFNYCINVNFLGSNLGYKKLLFPRRVLLTCLTAILLSTKTFCGSQSTLQTVLSRTCEPYRQGWPLGLPAARRCISGDAGTWLRWPCQSCVSSAGVRAQGSGCQHPLGTGAAPCWCSAGGCALADGRCHPEMGRMGLACWQKKQPVHECVTEANRMKSVPTSLTDLTFFFSKGENTNKPGQPKELL